jgi:hypothetical protein
VGVQRVMVPFTTFEKLLAASVCSSAAPQSPWPTSERAGKTSPTRWHRQTSPIPTHTRPAQDRRLDKVELVNSDRIAAQCYSSLPIAVAKLHLLLCAVFAAAAILEIIIFQLAGPQKRPWVFFISSPYHRCFHSSVTLIADSNRH